MSLWLEQVSQTLADELCDLPDAVEITQIVLRLVISALLSGILGFERSRSGKPAGLRTHMIVAIGASLLVIVPQHSGMDDAAISRIVQGIISGIGFLGAGAIIKSSETGVKGLTTAASLWLAVGVGIAVGFGRVMVAFVAVSAALVILSSLAFVEKWLPRYSTDPEEPVEDPQKPP